MMNRFLNIRYRGEPADVDIFGFLRFSQIQDAIKRNFSNSLSRVDTPHIQLYDESQLINTLDLINSLPLYFFTEGGTCLEIRTRDQRIYILT